MGYIDLDTIITPATGLSVPANYFDAIRDNFECVERHLVTTTLSSSAASIASGTLPTVASGSLLRVRIYARHTLTTGQDLLLRFNSDSGTNYVRQFVLGSDTTVSGDAVAAFSSLLVGSCGNESANRWSVTDVEVFEYLSSTHKSILSRSFDPRNLTAPLLIHIGGHWANTAAITSVSVSLASGGFVAGSKLQVFAMPDAP